jgi:hypothetical protein
MVITRADIARRRKLHKQKVRQLQLNADQGSYEYAQLRPKPDSVIICVDWGASHWRHFDSVLGAMSPHEASLVVYDKHTGKLVTGNRALDHLLPLESDCVRFENLKAYFDLDSDHRNKAYETIRTQSLPTTVEQILEAWWADRFGALMKRISTTETIVVALAHPAHYSPASVQSLKRFFSKVRHGHNFEVIVSEESTAALHGSRYSGFTAGDVVLVVDGGKSTIVSLKAPADWGWARQY